MVNKGTAIIIPMIPNKVPAIKIIKKISSGCDLTLFEKIIGEEILLSISCTIKNPMVTYMVVGSVTV
jgi:hypothetical protein